MKKHLFFILFSPLYLFCQEKDSLPSLKPIIIKRDLPKMGDPEKRDIRWADSLIKQIHFISLVEISTYCEYREKSDSVCDNRTTIQSHYYKSNEDIIVSKIDTLRFINPKELDSSDYKELILTAFGKRKSNSITFCYNPRHAILFRDSLNQLLGIYEVCFECGKAVIAFSKMEQFDIYSDDYVYIKSIFTKYGLYVPKKRK